MGEAEGMGGDPTQASPSSLLLVWFKGESAEAGESGAGNVAPGSSPCPPGPGHTPRLGSGSLMNMIINREKTQLSDEGH